MYMQDIIHGPCATLLIGCACEIAIIGCACAVAIIGCACAVAITGCAVAVAIIGTYAITTFIEVLARWWLSYWSEHAGVYNQRRHT